MKTFITAHLRDLEREGLDAALTRISGQVGIDLVCADAIVPPVTRIYKEHSGAVRAIESEDGACFQPDENLYTGTRLRPHTLSWMKQRNALDGLVRAAEKHRVGLRLRMNCCHQPSLARRNQMLTRVNILGMSSTTCLCPSHPAVREYLSAVAGDLCKNYGPSALELNQLAFGGDTRSEMPAFPKISAGADLSPAAELLDWCFCSACREHNAAKGMDVHAFISRAENLLGNLLDSDPSAVAQLSTWLSNDPQCKSFRSVSAEKAQDLLKSIRQRVTCDVCEVQPANPEIDDDAARLDSVVLDASEARIPVYRAYPPCFLDGPSLVSTVHQAAKASHPLIGFADYGMLSPVSLDWVRQAIRYAKRETGS